MPAADFAAAQQRIAARRALRNQHESLPSAAASTPPNSRLPGLVRSAWHALSRREGTRPAFRVGQVDAELLDAELLELMKTQVGDGLKLFGSHLTDTYAAEILLALRLVLFKLSIWNNNASYGAHLQGLRYSDARSNAPTRPPPKPWQKAAYGLITVAGRYAFTKWQDYLLAAADDYTRPDSPRLALLSRLTESLASAHDIASLASFLVFLVNGRYRTLTDRLLRLRLTPTSHATSREVSFEYLNRQLVWHAFTEFLLFLLPLVGISRWRRILSRTARRLRTAFLSLIGRAPTPDDDDAPKQAGELAFLPERTCAICYRDQNPTAQTEADVLAASAGGGVVGSAATDITNPYAALPCACVYCFACIAHRIANQDGDGWTCLRCAARVDSCRPWNGDILEPEKREHAPHDASTAKSVGFASIDGRDPEKAALAHVDPMPDESGNESGYESDAGYGALSGATGAQEGVMGLEKTRGLDLGEALAFSETEEWARASDGDEQSEEYDEDEEIEGEELEYEQ